MTQTAGIRWRRNEWGIWQPLVWCASYRQWIMVRHPGLPPFVMSRDAWDACSVQGPIADSNTTAPIPPVEGPRPISTLVWKDKQRFIGLIRDVTIDGEPFWETIELLQFSGGDVFNCNSGNNTRLLKHLTHWMPEPPL